MVAGMVNTLENTVQQMLDYELKVSKMCAIMDQEKHTQEQEDYPEEHLP